LDADEIDRVVPLDHQDSSAYSFNVRGPNASGMTSSIVLMPLTVSSSMPSAECSNSSCRHRPHGMRMLPCPSTHVKATSLPPPVMCRLDTSAHSAHRVRPYDAF